MAAPLEARAFAAPRRRKVGLVALLALALAVGCRTRLVPYHSQAELSREEARRLVTEAVDLQPRGFTPMAVEVTNEKLAVTHRNRTRSVIYFASMSETSIYRDRRGNYHFVRIRDARSRSVIRVWMPEFFQAALLVDGLTAMRGHAIAGAADPSRQRAEQRLEKLRRLREEMEAIRRDQADEQRRELEVTIEDPPGSVSE